MSISIWHPTALSELLRPLHQRRCDTVMLQHQREPNYVLSTHPFKPDVSDAPLVSTAQLHCVHYMCGREL